MKIKLRWNRDGKKKELWQRHTPVYKQFWINLKAGYRVFNRETRGMGLLFIMLVGALLMFSVIPNAISGALNSGKYKEALASNCLDSDFYIENWRACEDVEVRPERQQSNSQFLVYGRSDLLA